MSSLYAVYPKADDGPLQLAYILCLLNSKLCNAFVRWIAYGTTVGAFTKIRTNQLGRFPVPVPDGEGNERGRIVNGLIQRGSQLVALAGRLGASRTALDRARFDREFNLLDDQVDRLVYELYGLTDDEIALVEESVPSA